MIEGSGHVIFESGRGRGKVAGADFNLQTSTFPSTAETTGKVSGFFLLEQIKANDLLKPMKTNLNLFQVWRFCATALGIVSSSSLAAMPEDSADAAPPKTSIRWSEVGAKAGADYKGDGLAILPTADGARLRCVFQRLEGEATPEGLWLTSTVGNTPNDRFRIVTAAVGRQSSLSSSISSVANTGTVASDGQTVRFTRSRLVEEYSVSMDGVRQDFVVRERPVGDGELAVQLTVSGARVEPAAFGAQFVLENSGRKIAYSRLRATDATGKELPARMEVRPTSPMLALLVNDTDAVYPIRIDPTFSDANWISMGGIPGADGAVRAVVVDGSGNVYIGGDFTIAGEGFANHIAKWNGNSWSALGSGMNGTVYALALSGSDLYAGGEFTTATNSGGTAVTVNRIAKWDGSNWSALGLGISGNVYALAVSGNPFLLAAGGSFLWVTNSGGITVTTASLAVWDGTHWFSLGSGGVGGVGGTVWALAVMGGNLYAGGDFIAAGSTVVNHIAKWTGTGWEALGSGTDSTVYALAVSGSDLYAGGAFTIPANYVAKWTGSSWSGLGLGLSGFKPVVYALAVSGSDLFAGGGFFTADLSAAECIAKWNGSSWSALGPGLNSQVLALAASGGDLYVGGYFTGTYAQGADTSTPANHIAKWGISWSALGSGLNGWVGALAVAGGDLYAGGYFTAVGESPASNIAKWNGSGWSALGSGLNDEVDALAVSGSNLYAGGSFTAAGGSPATHIAKWNGSSWSALGLGMNDSVSAFAVSGTNLYAGGNFTMATNSSGATVMANYIAKWNGATWTNLGSGVDSAVYALAVSGSDLYAGGAFTIPANYVAKWNGSSWSALGAGMNDTVWALAASGNDLYAAGDFSTATNSGGVAVPANHIAKWNGSSWSALGSGLDDEVDALAVSGTDLYAGGYFTSAGGSPANRIARWAGSTWTNLGSGVGFGGGNDVVYTLVVSGSDLYAGGVFATAGGKVSGQVAKAIVSPPVLTIEPDGGGGYFIRFEGVPGSAYRLQRGSTLRGPWAATGPYTAPTSGLLEFQDMFPLPGQGFYRSVQP
jgi:hypothetical protein